MSSKQIKMANQMRKLVLNNSNNEVEELINFKQETLDYKINQHAQSQDLSWLNIVPRKDMKKHLSKRRRFIKANSSRN